MTAIAREIREWFTAYGQTVTDGPTYRRQIDRVKAELEDVRGIIPGLVRTPDWQEMFRDDERTLITLLEDLEARWAAILDERRN